MQVWLLVCLSFLFLLPTQVFGHSGRTDSYGGHNKTSNGTYHCHSGPCLDDAWKDAYDTFYPIGQKDGKKGTNRISEISENLYNELDTDVAEYMVPYAKKAYKTGFDDTYVPTFWEKYGWYIGGGTGVVLLLVFISLRRKKQMYSWDTEQKLTGDPGQSKGKLNRKLVIAFSSLAAICAITIGIINYQSDFNEKEKLDNQKTSEQTSQEKEPVEETEQQPVEESVEEPKQETVQEPVSDTTTYSQYADPAFIAFYEDTKPVYDNLIANFNVAELNNFNETQSLIDTAEKLKVIVSRDILNGQFEFARQGMIEDLDKLIGNLNAKNLPYEIIQNVQDIELNYSDILSITIQQ
jgi:hypothetical protein